MPTDTPQALSSSGTTERATPNPSAPLELAERLRERANKLSGLMAAVSLMIEAADALSAEPIGEPVAYAWCDPRFPSTQEWKLEWHRPGISFDANAEIRLLYATPSAPQGVPVAPTREQVERILMQFGLVVEKDNSRAYRALQEAADRILALYDCAPAPSGVTRETCLDLVDDDLTKVFDLLSGIRGRLLVLPPDPEPSEPAPIGTSGVQEPMPDNMRCGTCGAFPGLPHASHCPASAPQPQGTTEVSA